MGISCVTLWNASVILAVVYEGKEIPSFTFSKTCNTISEVHFSWSESESPNCTCHGSWKGV